MITLWHNPRCSKSRAALALLEGREDVTIRRYLDQPPSEEELRELLKKLDIAAIDLVRRKEADFKALGLSKDSSEDKLIAAMVQVPKLIERPIAIRGDQARIGRPPEAIIELL